MINEPGFCFVTCFQGWCFFLENYSTISYAASQSETCKEKAPWFIGVKFIGLFIFLHGWTLWVSYYYTDISQGWCPNHDVRNRSRQLKFYLFWVFVVLVNLDEELFSLYVIIGGSMGCGGGGARDEHPPWGPNSFIFVQFSAKKNHNKIIG